METIKDKIITNVLNNGYVDHSQGEDLLNLDIQDLEVVMTEPLHKHIGELNTRIEYLEMVEEDLRGENAVLRTTIIEKENSENSRNNTKDK